MMLQNVTNVKPFFVKNVKNNQMMLKINVLLSIVNYLVTIKFIGFLKDIWMSQSLDAQLINVNNKKWIIIAQYNINANFYYLIVKIIVDKYII